MELMGVPKLVVLRAFDGINENPISLTDFLEALLCAGIAGVAVRMILERQPSVGTFNRLFIRFF